jgi:hypothetical protein
MVHEVHQHGFGHHGSGFCTVRTSLYFASRIPHPASRHKMRRFSRYCRKESIDLTMRELKYEHADDEKFRLIKTYDVPFHDPSPLMRKALSETLFS